jgi:hypothetical protein
MYNPSTYVVKPIFWPIYLSIYMNCYYLLQNAIKVKSNIYSVEVLSQLSSCNGNLPVDGVLVYSGPFNQSMNHLKFLVEVIGAPCFWTTRPVKYSLLQSGPHNLLRNDSVHSDCKLRRECRTDWLKTEKVPDWAKGSNK